MKIGIRKKIIVSFSIFILASTFIWSLNYYKYQILTQKLQIIDKKDRIFNTILEARRYEKNFFLFNHLKDLQQAVLYVQDAMARVENIVEKHGQYTLDRNMADRIRDLEAYEAALSHMAGMIQAATDAGNTRFDTETLRQPGDRARQLGRQVTEEFESLLKRERARVNQLVRESGYYLYVALAGIFLLTFATTVFIFLTVNRPLKSIETAIHKIADGDYAHIPVVSTGDVFESLVDSLNNMIRELNRRNEQLVQTEKLASLGTLTSGVAHELNNPLNNISTSVQILLEEIEDGDMDFKRNLLVESEKQIDRAKDIVKALLEFSRSGHFKPTPVNFKRLVEKTVQLIKGEVPADIDLQLDIPDEMKVNLDVQRIQQVIINLVQNALQAMPAGGTIRISASPLEGQRFCFKVADSGTGIDKDALAKIFDPFFTTKSIGKGSGLGLSISHGIVKQHQGRIDVQSSPEQGTVFSIYLPTNLAVDI